MRTEFKLTNNIARLKRGSYIISDPCYVMSDADYEDVIEVGNETGYDIVNYPYDEIFICGVGDDGIYMIGDAIIKVTGGVPIQVA